MDGLGPIWPATRTQIDGVSIGDAWPCDILSQSNIYSWENIVPFHKLTQWLAYSLMVPMQKLLGVRFAGAELLTGLPEYHNGIPVTRAAYSNTADMSPACGLLIDFGVLCLKPPGVLQQSLYPDAQTGIPRLLPSHAAVAEWRAMTVVTGDRTVCTVHYLI